MRTQPERSKELDGEQAFGYAPGVPRSRTPQRGELVGLAERLDHLSDDFAHRDQSLNLALGEASSQLRRWLKESK